jgi:hypothetical protein
MAILVLVVGMRYKKLKNVVNTELEDNKYDTLSDDDYYFEFLKTEFNKEMQSFWKLLEGEDKE